MNFLADATLSEASFGKVAIFSKFDKMVRSFTPRANKSKVDVRIVGSSFECTYGPKKLFDLVTYLLIDNAIKYSPENESVIVNVVDVDGSVVANISSVGPKILDGEEEKIFEQNYRGLQAKQSSQDGSGIGLYAVKKLVEDGYAGTIRVLKGGHIRDIDGVSYDQITFELVVPIAG
jgi:signal transduction histidine kinase